MMLIFGLYIFLRLRIVLVKVVGIKVQRDMWFLIKLRTDLFRFRVSKVRNFRLKGDIMWLENFISYGIYLALGLILI